MKILNVFIVFLLINNHSFCQSDNSSKQRVRENHIYENYQWAKLNRLWVKELVLDFDASRIKTIPNNIGMFKKLEVLSIWPYKDIEPLPASISNLKNLKVLDIEDGGLKLFPNQILGLYQIEELWLWDNEISLVPNEIKNLGKLKLLCLDGNRGIKLSNVLYEIQSLESLYLSDTKLTYLSDSISLLINLKEIDLHDNYLVKLPQTLNQLKQLEDLDLGDNLDLDSVSAKVVYDIPSLKRLSLSNTKLIDFEGVSKLKNLEFLDLSGNSINDIEGLFKALETLPHLKELRLGNCNIESLPESILEFSQLKKLDLSGNIKLDIERTTTILSKSGTLESLNLSRINLEDRFESISELKNITHLDLSRTRIKELPDSFIGLDKLISLNLSSNPITEDSILKLSELENIKQVGICETHVNAYSIKIKLDKIEFYPFLCDFFMAENP